MIADSRRRSENVRTLDEIARSFVQRVALVHQEEGDEERMRRNEAEEGDMLV